MSVTVNVNNLSLAHRQSNGYSAATLPDVCKTPPGGDPVSYPNVAVTADLAKGTTTVTADGGNMCANLGSELSKSSGDEPGTMGGVKSGTYMKEATWMTYSFNVKLEGKGACRLTDKMFHNHHNTVNAGGEVQAPVETKPPAPCTVQQMKANIDKCDGGTGVYAKAKAAMGRNPKIEVSGASGIFGGHMSITEKKVVIKPNPDCCEATQTLIFELTNMSNASEFMKIHNDAVAGKVAREDLAKRYEKIEYKSVQSSYNSYDSCKTAWGCPEGGKARHDAHRKAKDFDEWYDKYVREEHKDYYRKAWDEKFKQTYEARQARLARQAAQKAPKR